MTNSKNSIKKNEDLDEEPFWQGPIRIILGLFLILLIVVFLIPNYTFPPDPKPKNIPTIDDINLENINITGERYDLSVHSQIGNYVQSRDPQIKQISTFIAAQSCESGERICHAKALYYFVRDNLDYVADPVNFDYVEPASEVLVTGGGDCESGTLLLASMLESVGIDVELVLIPGHAFLRAKMPELRKHYREGDWVYLDWTCNTCDFGDINRNYEVAHQQYFPI